MAPVDDPAAVRATAEQASKGYEYAFWRCHVCRAAYPDITFMRTVTARQALIDCKKCDKVYAAYTDETV